MSGILKNWQFMVAFLKIETPKNDIFEIPPWFENISQNKISYLEFLVTHSSKFYEAI